MGRREPGRGQGLAAVMKGDVVWYSRLHQKPGIPMVWVWWQRAVHEEWVLYLEKGVATIREN